MPVDSSGHYDKLNSGQVYILSEYLSELIRQNPGLSFQQLGEKAATRVHIDQFDTVQLSGIIRQAKREIAAGNLLNDEPTQRPDKLKLPTLPNDPANAGLVITKYVVEVTDVNTGKTSTSQETMVTQFPVSVSDIVGDIMSDQQAYITSLGSGPAATGPGGNYSFHVIILSVSIAK